MKHKKWQKTLMKGIDTCRRAMRKSGGVQVIITIDNSVMYWDIEHQMPVEPGYGWPVSKKD